MSRHKASRSVARLVAQELDPSGETVTTKLVAKWLKNLGLKREVQKKLNKEKDTRQRQGQGSDSEGSDNEGGSEGGTGSEGEGEGEEEGARARVTRL